MLLEEELDIERVTRSFATGGVTFSALLPMRSVPFRVVALLGLSDEGFPRKDRAAGFDLIARKPLPGDRSARDEDRQLFLEALLSARDRLITLYVGRAVHDNARFPASVVVAELVETLEAMRAGSEAPRPPKASTRAQLAFAFADKAAPPGQPTGTPFILEHPLQPWSPRYFGADADPRLLSFVEADAQGARALVERNLERPRFHAAPLIGITDEVVSVDDLARFLENPSRALLQRRLGVNLDEEVLVVEDHDPIDVGPLGAYSIGARLLTRAEQGARPESAAEWARATGILPAGSPGDVDLAPVITTAREIADAVRAWREGGRGAPIEVDLTIDKSTLVGVLYDVYPKAQVLSQYARVKPKNELAAWVRHLALAAASGEGCATVLVGRPTEGDATLVARLFEPIAEQDAKRQLSTLLGFYRLGQMAPLCLFPKASRKFAEVSARAGGAAQDALEAAKRTFLDDRKAPADADDSYVRRLFEGVDPFETSPVPFDEDGSLGLPSFERLSLDVFGPLLGSSRIISP
jgi:exodeoxyribonuclease V gamma subunit